MNLNSQRKQGFISGLGCNIWWGIMPIYWQMLIPIASSTIIFYRIVTVALVCLAAALITYDKETILAPLKDKKLVMKMVIAGIFITANWSIYIWAVNANYVIQTCIGYYMEPIVVCLFGLIIFKEKLDKYQWTALAFAAVGVVAVVIYFGELPVIGLSLAATFAIYAAMKKGLSMPPILSLLYETIFLMPFALIVIIYIEANGMGAWGVGEPYQYWIMLLCGLFTALPLTLFANATNKLSLFTVGLLEYISPTLALIVGIFVLGEAFEPIQIVAFAIIWIGLIFFSYGEYKGMKNERNN
ncbi:MAG: EamA family transporter RarD [Clostridia bacterium]|nr:EamA family transporter RarD [Clostridia bacterium]